MTSKIKQYISAAFKDVPKTRKSIELQEELFINSIENYNEQIKLNKSEEEAYDYAINNMDDIKKLTDVLKERSLQSTSNPNVRKQIAINNAIAVMLFILSPIALIVGVEIFDENVIGLTIMFVFIAVGTGTLIYTEYMKPTYFKDEENIIEEYKEWKDIKYHNEGLYETLSFAYWIIVVAIYLFVSFYYSNWHYSWIIFIIAVAIDNIIKSVIEMRR